jgi:hypothetical protein
MSGAASRDWLPAMNTKRTLIAVLAVTSLVAAAPAAEARAPDYKGKTKEGSKISVWLQKGNFAAYETTVPTTCVSAQGGLPLVRMTGFDAPVAFKVGRTAKYTDSKSYPTTHYKVTAHKKGKYLKGKMSLNYSQLDYTYDTGYRILTCYGTANFKLKHRHH